jgi:hypothetical protein
LNDNQTITPASPEAIKSTYYYKLFRVKRSDGRVTTVSVDPVLVTRAVQVLGGLRPVGALVRKAALEYAKTPEFCACSRFVQRQLQDAITAGAIAKVVAPRAPKQVYGTVAPGPAG